MKVLLTGAAGFVGSFVLKELLNHNCEVALILRSNTDTRRIKSELNKCTIINQSLESIHQAKQAIVNFAPDALIHLAWYGVTNDKRNDDAQLKNINMTYDLFEVAREAGIKTVIGLGSQAEYGPANNVINEQQPTNPTTLYGVSKLATYHLLNVLCNQYDIRFAWHRLFSSYGPQDHPSWFIPFLINELLNGRSPNMTPGTQLWDYIFVEDAASAIVNTLLNPNASGVFNLGSGEAKSIKEIASIIAKEINPHVTLGFGKVDFRPDQVMHLQADITRLKEVAGWKPSVPLSEGIARTIEWQRSHEH